MKTYLFIFALIIATSFSNCSSPAAEEESAAAPAVSMVAETETYDPHRGEGKWNNENVIIDEQLNSEWATSGKSISEVKCNSCHKMTDEKLVGPGWKGVTKKRTAPWIMNFITNPDPMIEKDSIVQEMLELCLVRMPNQNLSDGEARNILEYMRELDGAK